MDICGEGGRLRRKHTHTHTERERERKREREREWRAESWEKSERLSNGLADSVLSVFVRSQLMCVKGERE
jgi:hypothetical protein